MTDPTDTAIESAETSSSNAPRGPRNRFYFCVALDGKTIVYEAMCANSPDEAKKLFQEEYGLEAEVCDNGANIKGGGNGFYLSMGTGQSDAQRMSVTVTPAQLARRTTQAFKAKFKGWNVWGSGLKGCTVRIGSEDVRFADNQLVSIEFGERVDPENKSVQKPKLKKKEVIRFEDLESVEQV